MGDYISTLREVSRSGDYIVSASAAIALKGFLSVLDHPDFGSVPSDDADSVLKAAQQALPIIRQEAAKHLGLKLSKEL